MTTDISLVNHYHNTDISLVNHYHATEMYCFSSAFSATVFVNDIKPCSIWWGIISSRSGNRESNTFVLEGFAPLPTCTTHTYLARETPWSRRRFTQGEAQPLHSGCADPCEFLKCGNLDCIIYGSGGLRSRSPLILMLKKYTNRFNLTCVSTQEFNWVSCWGEMFLSDDWQVKTQPNCLRHTFCLLITRMDVCDLLLWWVIMPVMSWLCEGKGLLLNAYFCALMTESGLRSFIFKIIKSFLGQFVI